MTTAEKNAAISRMILAELAAGVSLSQAIDAVLGAGRFDAIVSDIYATLRK